MKTKEELNALKEEVEALNKKLAELTEEELAQVSGGKRRSGTGNCGFTSVSGQRCAGHFVYGIPESTCYSCPLCDMDF